MGQIVRNVRVGGRRTSLRLETAYWDALEACAAELGWTVHQVVTAAAAQTASSMCSMSSSVRTYLVQYYRGLSDRSVSNAGGATPPRPVRLVAKTTGRGSPEVHERLYVYCGILEKITQDINKIFADHGNVLPADAPSREKMKTIAKQLQSFLDRNEREPELAAVRVS